MILGSVGFSNHVIYVDFDLFMHHIMEQGYHGSLIGSIDVLQTKWHDIICISSPMSGKCCLGFVLLGHLVLIVT